MQLGSPLPSFLTYFFLSSIRQYHVIPCKICPSFLPPNQQTPPNLIPTLRPPPPDQLKAHLAEVFFPSLPQDHTLSSGSLNGFLCHTPSSSRGFTMLSPAVVLRSVALEDRCSPFIFFFPLVLTGKRPLFFPNLFNKGQEVFQLGVRCKLFNAGILGFSSALRLESAYRSGGERTLFYLSRSGISALLPRRVSMPMQNLPRS